MPMQQKRHRKPKKKRRREPGSNLGLKLEQLLFSRHTQKRAVVWSKNLFVLTQHIGCHQPTNFVFSPTKVARVQFGGGK